MIKFAVCLVILAALLIPSSYGCDMSAVILDEGTNMADFANVITDNLYTDYDVPQDYLAFVMSRSNAFYQNDGYGILYYPQNVFYLSKNHFWYKYLHTVSMMNNVWYTGNYFEPDNQPDVFDHALHKIQTQEADASIVMCHARNASTVPFAPGNHPFKNDLNNRTYTFMHNGFVTNAARTFMVNEINSIDPTWFFEHQPNYSNFPNASLPECWIDSEVLFSYLMCHIAAVDYEVYTGLRIALYKIVEYMKLSTNVVNFVLSDGERLFAFRSTSLTDTNSQYKLSFQRNLLGFTAIRTGVPTDSETSIKQNELIICNKRGQIERHPAILILPPIALRPAGENFNPRRRITGTVLHPNHSGINISFSLSEPSRVVIKVYNNRGQLVRNLKDENLNTGAYRYNWNGKDDNGRQSAKGVYLVELMAHGQKNLSKVVYLR